MSKTQRRADLLVEVGTEELPPAALQQLSEAFANGLAEALTTAGLALWPPSSAQPAHQVTLSTVHFTCEPASRGAQAA